MSSITLSREHGVNPGMEQCFYCMKDVGVILWGHIGEKKKDALWKAGLTTGTDDSTGKAPFRACLNREPCSECKDWMAQGIILISVDEEKSEDLQNPWRTGGWIVVKEGAVRRMIDSPELLERVLEQRVAFLPDDAWDMLGLPREEVVPT